MICTLSVDFHHIDTSIRDVLVTCLLMGWYELEQQLTVLEEESIQVSVQYEVFDLEGEWPMHHYHCVQKREDDD